ncbi:hypothetical protein SAMD00023353_4900930 [Rosellinia necatrix]|uniref:Uncharacterized protein n=1 Tax=Rosellinia necatrix TaxID=77044 RepID=A0A1W2TPL9_ROSNE|nr:hypothetical protein SAMD00023353_4900930 [Rosellinia necatrix]
MKWLAERINDSQGTEIQGARQKFQLFDAICTSLGMTSARWETLVNSLYAEFEANQQQMTIDQETINNDRADLDARAQQTTAAQENVNKERAEVEASKQQLKLAQESFDKDKAKLKEDQRALIAVRTHLEERRVRLEEAQRSFTTAQDRHRADINDMFDQSLEAMTKSHQDIMDKIADQHKAEEDRRDLHDAEIEGLHRRHRVQMDALQERYDEAQAQICELEAGIEQASDIEAQASRERITRQIQRIATLEQQLNEAAAESEQHVAERQSLRGQLEQLNNTFADELDGERRSHEETQGLVSRLEEQLTQVKVDLVDRDQLNHILSADLTREKRSRGEAEALASELRTQLSQGQETLRSAMAESNRHKESLAKTESSLKTSQDRVKELEVQAGSKRRRDTSEGGREITIPAKRIRLPSDSPEARIWSTKVECLYRVLRQFRLICTPDANISLGEVVAKFLEAFGEQDHDEPLIDFVDDAPVGNWYCFQHLADHLMFSIRNTDALIEDDECYVHKDSCFQISNAKDVEGYGSIYCRLKEYSCQVKR